MGCTLRAGRRILVDISTRAATCVTHLWSLYQEALADYTPREATTQPPDDDDPPRSLPCPPPHAHLRHPGSAAPPPSPLSAISSVRRRRFRARPLRHHPGPRDSGPTLHHPNPTKPLAPGSRYRTSLGPPAYNPHMPPATSGTPAWGRTTAKRPKRFPHSEDGLL